MTRGMSVRFELFVDDLDVAIDFWTRVLGFAVERSGSGYTSLVNGEVTIGLGRVSDLPPSDDGPGFSQERLASGRGGGVEIVLEVSDLDVVHERVLVSGWPLAAPITLRPWGLRDFRVADPDGYYVRVTDRPRP